MNKINIPLLLKIKARILKEPRQFQMKCWFVNDPAYIPNCGTAACIMGFALTLGRRKGKPSTMAHWRATRSIHSKNIKMSDFFIIAGDDCDFMNKVGQKYLGLDESQEKRLSSFKMWPEQFQFYTQEGTPEYAKQAARRIDHFIATEGKE